MFEKRRIKCCVLLVFGLMAVLHLHLWYFCSEKQCALTTESTARDHDLSRDLPVSGLGLAANYHTLESRGYEPCTTSNGLSVDYWNTGNWLLLNGSFRDMTEPFKFDTEGIIDTMVFLHMQKTGGTTFGKHLVTNLEVTKPCVCQLARKKCDCKNSRGLVWLVSRYTTGWRCGLHADWTELTSCVDGMLNKMESTKRKRRYIYITILRDPIARYISEYKHVRRGATWRAARLQCNGRQASLQEIPFCFEGDDWHGVSLDDFMDCPHNLANNRQTRMLANLSVVGCYQHLVDPGTRHQCDMLQSAKDNLRKMAFFGLTEYQKESQYMFQRTFGLKFKSDFHQYNHTHSSEVSLTSSQRHQVIKLNKLDISLYTFAKTLFFKRLHKMLNMETDGIESNIEARNSFDTDENNIKYLDTVTLDYEEEDENEADDDSEYNGRIVHLSTRLT